MMKDNVNPVGCMPMLDDRELPKRGADVQALFAALDEEIESAREKAVEAEQLSRQRNAVFDALFRLKHTLTHRLDKAHRSKDI